MEKIENPARKGDAVLIERTTRTYYNNGPSTEKTDYVFAMVASCKRDGSIATVKDSSTQTRGFPIPSYWGNGRRWVIEAGLFDAVRRGRRPVALLH